MALFKDKLNEIFGVGGPIETPPEQAPVVELSPIEDFRNNIRARLNGIKDKAVCGGPSAQELACGPATIAPIGQPPLQSDGMLVERDNEIGLETLKGSIRKMGPQKVSEIIAKLSAEKSEVDKATGVATSEFDKFIDGLKQEAAEALLGSEATPSTPDATPEGGAPAPGATPAAGEAPKTPEQKLPDLVQTKL